MTQRSPRRIGRFEIVEALGSGATGVVYKARDTRLERDVAVKLLADDLAADEELVRRFEQEARAASSLNHPNIVTVFDAGVDAGTGYIVTELLHGTTLRTRLAGRPLPLEFVMAAGSQIAAALAAAHAADLIHRDVKPENIFVTAAGTVKLLDFGIARLIRRDAAPHDGVTNVSSTWTAGGAIVGTPAYMAPEQIRGLPVDARTDVFALGCVLHEMLTGAGPFARATSADTMAAVLHDNAPARTAHLPPSSMLERIVRRCLEKDAADRFQSAADLRFALETAGDSGLSSPAPARRSAGLTRWLAAAAPILAAALAISLLAPRVGQSPAGSGPVVVRASTVVSSAQRPIAPAVSPDGKWVTYIGLAGGTRNLYVQFLNAGAQPVQIVQGDDLPLQDRTTVGGIDVLPDGSGIVVAGRPLPVGLWRVPGIWIVPPMGGPPRRLTDRYASVRWSPDGQRIAGIVANPLIGDAIAVAAADGQDERILVAAAGGLHLHHVAWAHDGRYIYYTRTFDPSHSLADIYRVPVAGGAPEVVVHMDGAALYPMPTPDGKALLYAGDRSGDGLNIWWRPFDGSPERRLTAGVGEFTEPFISRDGQRVVAIARKRRGQVVRVPADASGAAALEPLFAGGEGDTDPTVCASSGRIYVDSTRGGRRQIWSVAADGRNPVPITSGTDSDRRPAISPDCSQIAFQSSRNGRRGIWVVPADGGTPRAIAQADVIDRVSWSPDGQRLLYAAGPERLNLFVASVTGGNPVQIPSDSPRVPVWSPVAEQIAYVALIENKPYVHIVTIDGKPVRPPVTIDSVSVPTAMAWSPDGTRLGLVNLPGRSAAEAWVMDVASGRLTKIVDLPAPSEFEGISWSPDGRWLVLGRSEFETEVLLIELR